MSKFSNQIMGFYHPVKTLFLDDNAVFLDALSLEFSNLKSNLMFTNPDQAMAAIG